MPPLPLLSAPPPAHIRIPTFRSPTGKRTPIRAPQNRQEAREARLRTAGDGQWASLGQLAQAGPASLAHLLGRKDAGGARDPEKKGSERRASKAPGGRRSIRGAAGAEQDGARGDAVASSSAQLQAPAASTSAVPAPRRAPRLPRAAARPVPALPSAGTAVEATAAERRLSGTKDAPSLAGKTYRRESDPTKLAGKGDGGAPGFEPIVRADTKAGTTRRHSRAADKTVVAGDVSASSPSAAANADTSKARRSSLRAPPKKRAASALAQAEVGVPLKAPSQAKKRGRPTVQPPGAEEPDTEAVPDAVAPVPAKKARKSAAVPRAKEEEIRPTTAPTTKPTKRVRPSSEAAAIAAVSPLPSTPRAGPSRARAASSPSPSPSPDEANDAPPAKKTRTTAKQVRIATLRAQGNTGPLNTLDVVLGGTERVFARVLDGATDPRKRKALKLVRAEVQASLLTRSALLSTHTHTSKLLSSARARAKRLRGELLAAQVARARVRREMRDAVRAYEAGMDGERARVLEAGV